MAERITITKGSGNVFADLGLPDAEELLVKATLLARALKVSADELLGLKAVTEKTTPKAARLLKRLQKITDLPAADQRTVLKLLDALHESRQRTNRPRATG